MAELVFLGNTTVRPVPELLGEENSQALTEAIYTQETSRIIFWRPRWSTLSAGIVW